MTDKEIKTAVKYAKSWLDTGREGYEGYALEKHATQYAKYVVALAQELAALKEKHRWRRLSETKPSAEDAPLEIVYFTNDNHFDVRLAPVYPGGLAYADGYYKYWRPWDLPEEDAK